MYVVGDIDDVFVPVPPEELLVRVSDPAARTLLNSLLEMIPRYEAYACMYCALLCVCTALS